MAILTMTETGNWYLDPELEPMAFWPYTTIVHERLFSAPVDAKAKEFLAKLIKQFRDEGINAYEENKCAFEFVDHGPNYESKVYYVGFKDGLFHVGLSVRADKTIEPNKKGSYKTLKDQFPEVPNLMTR